MRTKTLLASSLWIAALVGGAFVLDGRSFGSSADSTCNVAVAPTTVSGSTLDTFTPTKNGIVYNSGSAQLEVSHSTGLQAATPLGVADTFVLACAGDFDGDGWTDFVASADGADKAIRWYKNQTYENPAPGCAAGGTAAAPDCAGADWNLMTIRTPKFVRQAPNIDTRFGSGGAIRGGIACGDINNDGKPDFVHVTCDAAPDFCTDPVVTAYLNTGNPAAPFSTAASFKYAPLASTTRATMGRVTWAHQFILYDYNGDGWLDMVWGAGSAAASGTYSQMASNGGLVRVYPSNGVGPKPTFSTTYLDLIDGNSTQAGQGFNWSGPVSLQIVDFNGDGTKELLATGVSANIARLYPLPVVPTNFQTLSTSGEQVALAGDYNGDGKTDLIFGTDNWNAPAATGGPNYSSSTMHQGGVATYWRNNGTATPFSSGLTQTLSTHQDPHSLGNRFDFDLGFQLDYDHDPNHTLDPLVADGNHAGTFYLYPVRTLSTYASCGTVDSDVLTLDPSIANAEATVTQVRLDPSPDSQPSGTSITWYASNDGGNTWVAATTCTTPVGTTDVCATFSTSSGKQIRWRAVMCSNATHTQTPTISSVSTSFAYVTAQNHFRSGPIAKGGIIYQGAYREPGAAGHFFAIDDASGSILWDTADKLDAQGDGGRTIYTASTTNALLAFTTGNAGTAALQSTLSVGTTAQAQAVIGWTRAAKWGFTSPYHLLGGVEGSTAALLDKPAKPYWYGFSNTSATERTLIDSYITANQNNQNLLFFGAKDGMLHAVYTNPTNSSDPLNGKEAWAFVPTNVAQRLLTDCTAANGGTCAANPTQPATFTAFVDGSPTLASGKINGAWKTILVAGLGAGGKAVYALDVTQTISPSTGAIVGPTPLWSFTDANMGLTVSKPTVIRVNDAGTERWLAVFASGPPPVGLDIGDSLYAVDLYTGALVWRFDLNDTGVYFSTAVVAAETDDAGEPGSPTKDGYIDRIFIADSKGRVWKLDPGTHVGTSITPIGSVNVGLAAGQALFSTRLTSGTVEGADRPITGGMAVAEDGNGNLVVYFGSGGLDDTTKAPDTAQYAFYGIYAKDGTIKAKYVPAPGVKFFGGVALTESQLIVNTSQITGSGTLGLCTPSAGSILVFNKDTATTTFQSQFAITSVGGTALGRLVSPIFVTGGSFYTATADGKIVTSQPGTGAATGTGGGGSGGSGSGVVNGSMSIKGWRQVN